MFTSDFRLQSKSFTMESLAFLCKDIIAKRLEKYSPQLLGILPESEWECIVERKYRMTAPMHASWPSTDSRPLSDGRLIPAISADVMAKIEQTNPHFAQSAITDNLVWKDCVDYKFRRDGSTRPSLFRTTWPMLVEQARNISDELNALAAPPTIHTKNLAQEHKSRTDKLLHLIYRMESLPMSKPLLEQSNLGKALNTFIKECRRLEKLHPIKDNIPHHFPNFWTLHHNDLEYIQSTPMAPIDSMENCLMGWKQIASGNDDMKKLDGRKNHHFIGRDYSGRSKNTTVEQHEKDLQRIQSCMQWRHLYKALTDRMHEMIANHGNRMRQLRDNKDQERPKVALVSIRTSKKLEKQEAILSGAMGSNKKNTSPAATSTSTMFKQLRKEAAVVTRLQKGRPETHTKVGGFGHSVSDVAKMKKVDHGSDKKIGDCVSSIRPKNLQMIALDGGKRMFVPNPCKKTDDSNKKAKLK